MLDLCKLYIKRAISIDRLGEHVSKRAKQLSCRIAHGRATKDIDIRLQAVYRHWHATRHCKAYSYKSKFERPYLR
eukprot:2407361-Pleurochrysis_carterae.AAC.1